MFKELNNLKPFLKKPRAEYGVREFARLQQIAPATASKFMEGFAKKKVLKKRTLRKYNLYKANSASQMYREVKRFHTILQLHSSGLLDTLHEEYLNPTIILFGSAAQGLDDENSDIDLCIITEYKKEYMYQKKFEKKLGKELQIFIIKNISEISNKHLRSSIANGINLQGMIVWSLTSATKKGTVKKRNQMKKE